MKHYKKILIIINETMKNLVVFFFGTIAIVVFIIFLVISVPFFKIPRETHIVTLISGMSWDDSNNINDLLEKGWCLTRTSVDGCGNLVLEFSK